jgi:hypothetical protein
MDRTDLPRQLACDRRFARARKTAERDQHDRILLLRFAFGGVFAKRQTEGRKRWTRPELVLS